MAETFEERIAKARSSEEIAEICKQQGEAVGILVRERDGSVNVRESFVAPQVQAPIPTAHTGQYSKVIYPSGNNRFEICADSQEALADLEKRILQMFGH